MHKNKKNDQLIGFVSLSKFFLIFVILLVFVFLSSNIYSLQILNGDDNYKKAVENTYSRKVIQAKRGVIRDRNGSLLVDNKSEYKIILNPNDFAKEEFEELVMLTNSLIEVDRQDVFSRYEKFNTKSEREEKFVLVDKISEEGFDMLFDELKDFRGITFLEESIREYLEGERLVGVTGYVGAPLEADVVEGVNPLSKIGKTGIEAYYDSMIRGKDGEEIDLVRLDGSREVFSVDKEKGGGEVFLTIDNVWQNKLYDLLKESVEGDSIYGGGGVIVESDTGKVVSLVSYPSFDPNLFSNGISFEEYNILVEDSRLPLMNRVIGMQASPGSIFKPLVGTMALGMDLVNPNQTYYSGGCEKLDDSINFCEADGIVLGDVDFYTAIARSSNLYFCNIGRSLNEQFGDDSGIQYILNYTDKFGIGKKTGIDLIGELSGNMASPEYVQKTQGRGWYLGDMCNSVIGQGVVTVTPIQMVMAASSLVNGGRVNKPYLVDRVMNDSGEVIFQNVSEERGLLDVDNGVLDDISKAMKLTVTDLRGSGHLAFGSPGDIRMKTGSADAKEKLVSGEYIEGAHSWVFGSFTYQGKDYSFVVVQQYGGRGYKTVPIISKFINCVYNEFEESCEVNTPK